MKTKALWVPLLLIVLSLTMAAPIFAGEPVNGVPDHSSVYDYGILSVSRTGVAQVTVKVHARYCEFCNPNPANEPGCPGSFDHGYPPPYYPYQYYNFSVCYYNPGRYAAVRLETMGGTVLATLKKVLNPSNWPLDVVHIEPFVFDGLTLVGGQQIRVRAEFFCSWCGHWYPEPMIMTVIAPDIDIKPSSYPNSINLKNNGVIPVAILGSATFDVAWVDLSSVRFAGAQNVLTPSFADVNSDGYGDVVLHFRTRDTNILPGDTSAALWGNLFDSTYFWASDSIRTVPAK